MQDIDSFLQLHQNKISGLFPWTLEEFVQWASNSSRRGDLTISLANGEVLFLTLNEDCIYYQPACDDMKVIPHFDKPPYGPRVSSFFENSAFDAASFFARLQESVLALPFVEYVTCEEESTYVESVPERRKALYKLKVGVKDQAEINITRSGLQAISKTIQDKIKDLTEHYGSNTISTKGKVYYKLNVDFGEYMNAEKNYNPRWDMSMAIVYYVLPRTPTEYEVSQLKQCSTFLHRNKQGDAVYRINEWATIRSLMKCSQRKQKALTKKLSPYCFIHLEHCLLKRMLG